MFVCKIPLFARRNRPKGQARRATIGYLVYKLDVCSTAIAFVSLCQTMYTGEVRAGRV